MWQPGKPLDVLGTFCRGLQVAAVDAAGGRFLLAAETAHVMGVDLPSKQRVTSLAVCLCMSQQMSQCRPRITVRSRLDIVTACRADTPCGISIALTYAQF